MASDEAASNVADGPVVTHINKRIRNLKKKLKRIEQLEDSIAQGRSVIKNKEQEELLKSKPVIMAVVDELEKSREPLSVAVDEEITLALHEDRNKAEKAVYDLLSLIYFGSLLKQDLGWDERHWIFRHGMVHPVYRDTLGVDELDAIELLSSLMISRPEDGSLLSHEDALQRCIEHANHWICKSDKLIDPDRGFTYADVREWLTMVMSMGYFKSTPSSGTKRYEIGPYLPLEPEEKDHRDGSSNDGYSDVSEGSSFDEHPEYWEVDGLEGSD